MHTYALTLVHEPIIDCWNKRAALLYDHILRGRKESLFCHVKITLFCQFKETTLKHSSN